jgi:uracil phosphoribosyltransferase
MGLTDLVRLHFGKNIIKGINLPEGEIRPGYASHIEMEHGTWTNAVRIARAWDRPPTERRLLENKIGTYNLGLPPLIATVMQGLRDKRVNPENPEDVRNFQQGIAQVTQLVTPLILADVICRKYNTATPAEIECKIEHKKGTLKIDYEEAIGSQITGVKNKRNKVTTVSGYHSLATIADLSIEEVEMRAKIPLGYLIEESRALRVAFLAIHRGGMLPSLVAADLAKEMGCEAYVIGVDAKRRAGGAAHSGRVVGIDLKKPDGYAASSYSQLVADAYVFPADYEKPDVLVVIDPMLATGLSSREAIRGCLETLALKSSDVYCASFFAGDYRGIKTLLEPGFNVHIVAHDQMPLTENDYIVPGLGDAGDKMSGIIEGRDVKDAYTLLKSMEHLVNEKAVSMQQLESYARQMTGRRLAA